MNVLVIGGGGREHAIITALAKSKKVDKLYAAPGNGGISKYAECFNVKATDIDGCVELAKKLRPDYVFVAPDDPLVMGMWTSSTQRASRPSDREQMPLFLRAVKFSQRL